MRLGTASHKASFQAEQTRDEQKLRETTNLLLFVAHDDQIDFLELLHS